MIFSIVRIGNTVELYPTTERELRQTLKVPFELLEIHKNQQVAEQRLNTLRGTQYKKRRKKKGKVSPEGRLNISLAKRGSKNPMHGPISDKRRRNISIAQRGNQYRRGKKLNPQQRAERSELIKRIWVTRKQKNERRKWCHCPNTGQEKLVLIHQKPVDFVWGRSYDVLEALQYGQSRRKY